MYHSLFQPIVAYLGLLGPIAEFTTQIYAKTSNNTPELLETTVCNPFRHVLRPFDRPGGGYAAVRLRRLADRKAEAHAGRRCPHVVSMSSRRVIACFDVYLRAKLR